MLLITMRNKDLPKLAKGGVKMPIDGERKTVKRVGNTLCWDDQAVTIVKTLRNDRYTDFYCDDGDGEPVDIMIISDKEESNG
jgi:hypothetical protein